MCSKALFMLPELPLYSYWIMLYSCCLVFYSCCFVLSRVASCCTRVVVLSRVSLCCYSCSFLDYIFFLHDQKLKYLKEVLS